MAVPSVSVPDPVLVKLNAPLMIPEAVNVLAEFTFHVWLAPRAMAFAIDRFLAEADMSMPLAPSVSVPAPVMSMSVNALATLRLFQELEVPSVNPAPSEELAQVAASPEPGEPFAPPPPDQTPAVAPVRSVPEAALVAVAACAAVVEARNKTASMAGREIRMMDLS